MKDVAKKLLEVVGKNKVISLIGGLLIAGAASALTLSSEQLCSLICEKCAVVAPAEPVAVPVENPKPLEEK